MADNAEARAREALKRAQDILRNCTHPASTSLADAVEQMTSAIESLAARERNVVAQQALLDARLLRVERNRLFSVFNRLVSASIRLMDRARTGLPHRSADERQGPADYDRWISHETALLPPEAVAREISRQWTYRPLISFLLTVRTGTAVPKFVESLQRQIYSNLELCVAIEPGCESALCGWTGQLHCIDVKGVDDSGALNAAANLATGQYFCAIPNDGFLSPFALYYVIEALQQGPADIVYCDEDALDAQGRRVHPLFKPDWSPELLLSTMYVGHLLFVRRELWSENGGLLEAAADAALYDFLLRLADSPLRVNHIPRVLYHRPERAPVPEGNASAITRAIERRERIAVDCRQGPAEGTWVVRRPGTSKPMTAIVCSKSAALLKTCLESVLETAGGIVEKVVVVAHEERGPDTELEAVAKNAGATIIRFHGPFHFAEMNNLGAIEARTANLLFLNDDIRATRRGWAELLAEHLSRDVVGIAGSVLCYPVGTLQHAGITLGIGDGVGHTGRHQRTSSLWPWLLAPREVSAVTGACLAVRKRVFDELGGFDVLFPSNYNDVDLCFRARDKGYCVVCVPAPGLIHAECRSRPGVVHFEERFRFYERWAKLLWKRDPYYSPALAADERIALNLDGDDWYRSLLRE